MILQFFFCLVVFYRSAEAYYCLTDDNEIVDWFILYKFPENNNYAYILSDAPAWKKTTSAVTSNDGMLANTLKQMYQNLNDPESFNAVYNDELPEGIFHDHSDKVYGHMKGILTFKRNGSGIWIIHSAPKFPPGDHYEYPDSAIPYGQIFMCVSTNYSSLGVIKDQLLVAHPHVYSYHLPDAIATDFPGLDVLVNNKGGESSDDHRIGSLVTLGGVPMVHFSKSAEFNQDLYSGLVAPQLQSGLLVEAWRNGRGDLPSNCSGQYKVENIRSIRLMNVPFVTTKDHSKWVISLSTGWVCVADINRQSTQFTRGGGSLCYSSALVWGQLKSIVSAIELCESSAMETVL